MSPWALPVWEQVRTWEESRFPENGLRRIFSKFLNSPGKVLPGDYRDLDQQIQSARLPALVPTWGDHLKQMQGLADGRQARKGFPPARLDRIRSLDRALKASAQPFPPALARVLLHPFGFHTARLLKSLSSKDPQSAAEVIRAAPFLFSIVAGPKAPALQEQLVGFEPDHSTINDWLARIRNARGETLENRAALLGRLRAWLPSGIPEGLRGPFQDFYLEILDELMERKSHLPLRDQADLARVLERLVNLDGHLFWDSLEEKRDLARLTTFLKKAAALEALQAKPALAALLITDRSRDNDLRDQALKVIQTSPPTPEDLTWVLNEWEDFILSRPGALKLLLDLPGSAETLQPLIAAWWITQLDLPLSLNSDLLDRRNIFFALIDPEAIEAGKRIWSFLNYELQGFKAYPAFSTLLDYLESFPGAAFSGQRFLKFIQIRLQKSDPPGFLIDWLYSTFQRARSLLTFSPENPESPFIFEFYAHQQQVILDLLSEEPELLREAAIPKIEMLADLVCQIRAPQRTAILRGIYLLLNERCRSGETETRPLIEKVGRLLERGRKPRKKPWKPKKQPLSY